jgi:SAM-dependent methyltransferase
LRRKLAISPASPRIVALQGSFNQIPLETNSVGLALSCSAFTADSAEGGDPGLAELRRVTRPGGKIVFIWPRPEDRSWFVARGFHYVTLPCDGRKMRVHFRSVESALRCVRHFYPENENAVRYILDHQQAAVPFAVLGITNPPHEFCWLTVE